MKSKNTLILNLNLDWRVLLILAVIVAALMFAYSAVGAKDSPKQETQSNPIQAELFSAPYAVNATQGTSNKLFYLTNITYLPTNALTACGSGYHMASLWEILDVSNLTYDIGNIGAATQTDSGWGPPTFMYGWVHTGNTSSGSSTPGTGNCMDYGSSSGTNYGTIASLPNDWLSSPTFFIWWLVSRECNLAAYVWCVEN